MITPICLESISRKARWPLALALAMVALGVPASAVAFSDAPSNDKATCDY